jgi:hypothetical protein
MRNEALEAAAVAPKARRGLTGSSGGVVSSSDGRIRVPSVLISGRCATYDLHENHRLHIIIARCMRVGGSVVVRPGPWTWWLRYY